MSSHTRTRRMALSSILATIFVFILAVLSSRHQVRSPDLLANDHSLPETNFRQTLSSPAKYHGKVPVLFGRNANVFTRQAPVEDIPWIQKSDAEKLVIYAADTGKGGSYLCELRSSIEEADKLLFDKTKGRVTNSQSTWLDTSSLQTWGWTGPRDFEALGEELIVDAAYKELGLDKSNNKAQEITQTRNVNIGDIVYPVSTIFLVCS